jgi:hypothetical protein
LKGADQRQLSVAAALTHVIRAYHPTARLPEREAERRGLYLSVLDGQRALLLMDNAADRTQLESLIPPSSCRSRHANILHCPAYLVSVRKVAQAV